MPKLNAKKFAENRKHILDAAEACFMQQGFHKASMRDIAEEAGLSLGNIYRYFENKDALVEGFIADAEKEFSEALELLSDTAKPKKVLKQILVTYIKELARPSTAALHLDILAEALRNPAVMKIIRSENPHTTYKFKDVLQLCVEQNKLQLPVGAEHTANIIEAVTDRTAITCLTKKGYTLRKATTDLEVLLDLLIVETK